MTARPGHLFAERSAAADDARAAATVGHRTGRESAVHDGRPFHASDNPKEDACPPQFLT